jgi:hypothetical protein
MSNEVTEWHPPQEKIIHGVVQWSLIGVGIVAAAFAVKTFVPTIRDAVALLTDLLTNLWHGGIAIMACLTLYIIYVQVFTKKGKINALFAQAYSSAIHQLTLELLNVDPMSPLKDNLVAVQLKKANFDEQFAKFDGQISAFKMQEDDLRAQSDKAEKMAKAAHGQGNDIKMNQLLYQAGSTKSAADDIEKMRMRLVPVRAIIVRLQSEAADIIWKLGIDIQTTEKKWNAANALTGLEKSARSIMSSSDKSGLAAEAQNIINTKYSVAIGRLANLETTAMPLLDSADLEKATYSQEYLDKWNAEAAPMITAQVIPMSQTLPAPSSFDALLTKR